MSTRRFPEVIFRIAVLAVAIGLVAGAAMATNGYFTHGFGTRAKAWPAPASRSPRTPWPPPPTRPAWPSSASATTPAWRSSTPTASTRSTAAPSGSPGTFGLAPGTVESDSEFFFVPNFGASLGDRRRQHLRPRGLRPRRHEHRLPDQHLLRQPRRPASTCRSCSSCRPTRRKFGGGNHAIGIAPILAYQMFEVEGLQAFGGVLLQSGQPDQQRRDDVDRLRRQVRLPRQVDRPASRSASPTRARSPWTSSATTPACSPAGRLRHPLHLDGRHRLRV